MKITLIVDVDIPVMYEHEAPAYVAANFEKEHGHLNVAGYVWDAYIPSPEELEDRGHKD